MRWMILGLLFLVAAAELRPGAMVEIRHGMEWDRVVVARVDGDTAVIDDRRFRREREVSIDQLRPVGGWPTVGVGPAERLAGTRWQPVEVVEVEPDRAKVVREGMNAIHAQWVDMDKLRPAGGWAAVGGVAVAERPVIAERPAVEPLPGLAVRADLVVPDTRGPFKPKLDAVHVSPSHGVAAVVHVAAGRDRWVQLVPLRDGVEATGPMKLPQNQTFLATDGSVVLTNDRSEVVVHDVTPTGLTERSRWTPDRDRAMAVGRRAWLLPGDRVLIDDGADRRWLFGTDGETPAKLASLPWGEIAVAADGEHVAVNGQGSLTLFDVETGESAESYAMRPGTPALSPDLKRAAILSTNEVTVLDRDTGELLRRSLPSGNARLTWVNDEVLLARDTLLNAATGDYHGRVTAAGQADAGHLVLATDTRLRIAPLPAGEPVGVQPVLAAGAKIRLDLKLTGDPAAVKQAETNIRESLEAAGYVVADDADAVLTGRSEDGESSEMTYRGLGERDGGTKVSRRNLSHALTLTVDGDEVWTGGTTWTLPSAVDPDGQSLTAAIDAARRRSAAGLSADLPPVLHAPADLRTLPARSLPE